VELQIIRKIWCNLTCKCTINVFRKRFWYWWIYCSVQNLLIYCFSKKEFSHTSISNLPSCYIRSAHQKMLMFFSRNFIKTRIIIETLSLKPGTSRKCCFQQVDRISRSFLFSVSINSRSWKTFNKFTISTNEPPMKLDSFVVHLFVAHVQQEGERRGHGDIFHHLLGHHRCHVAYQAGEEPGRHRPRPGLLRRRSVRLEAWPGISEPQQRPDTHRVSLVAGEHTPHGLLHPAHVDALGVPGVLDVHGGHLAGLVDQAQLGGDCGGRRRLVVHVVQQRRVVAGRRLSVRRLLVVRRLEPVGALPRRVRGPANLRHESARPQPPTETRRRTSRRGLRKSECRSQACSATAFVSNVRVSAWCLAKQASVSSVDAPFDDASTVLKSLACEKSMRSFFGTGLRGFDVALLPVLSCSFIRLLLLDIFQWLGPTNASRTFASKYEYSRSLQDIAASSVFSLHKSKLWKTQSSLVTHKFTLNPSCQPVHVPFEQSRSACSSPRQPHPQVGQAPPPRIHSFSAVVRN